MLVIIVVISLLLPLLLLALILGLMMEIKRMKDFWVKTTTMKTMTMTMTTTTMMTTLRRNLYGQLACVAVVRFLLASFVITTVVEDQSVIAAKKVN